MRLDLLILARIGNVKRPKRADLRDLRALAAPGSTEETFERILDERIAALVASGLIGKRPLRITEEGRSKIKEAFGVDRVPAWAAARDHHLPALALGIRLPRKKNAIRAAVLARRLDLEPLGYDLDELVNRAIATAIKAARGDTKTVAAALARRWLDEEPVSAVAPPSPPAPWSDGDLVAAVRTATVQVPAAGRFGDDKVFVSALWRQLGEGARFPGLTLDDFKHRLVDANRQGALTLARADLVGAMDRREVAASEIRYLNATFHFVLDRSRP